MPTAKGADWEKYKKEFADDEVEEKKITPLSDEYVGTTSCTQTSFANLSLSGISRC